jgi:hypothetical protein
MAVSINPPPQLRIPKQFFDNSEIRSYFEQKDTIIFQMWQRMGGNTDLIDDNKNLIKGFSWPIGNAKKDFRAVTITDDYTMLSFDFVNVTGGKTITFPKYPEENDVIIIRKANGVTVELDGNGRTMNGETTGQMHNNGTAIEFYYFISTDEWFAR